MKVTQRNERGRLAAAGIRCQPDSRLVGLVRDGRELAFEEIVRRYRRPLVAFAGAIVPRDAAEDVVQEALTKAHGALKRGDAEINLRPWLYTIVRNRALNALRDEPMHDHLDENFDGVPQPPEVAARREELAALIAAVRALPAPQREAIVGRELEGRSHEEIAASLGTTPGAVRGLIYRARTALRDGVGLLIPMPLLRAMLDSGPVGPNAAGAGGTAAAGLAAGGGGIAMKAGATLGVAVIAVGSGLAIQHRGSGSNEGHAGSGQPTRSGALAGDPRWPRPPVRNADSRRDALDGDDGPDADSGGPGEDGHRGSSSGPGASSGPDPGSGSGGGSSGERSGSGGGRHDGSSGGEDDGATTRSGDGDDTSGGSSGGSGGTGGSGGSGGDSSGSGERGGSGETVETSEPSTRESSGTGDGATSTTSTTTTTTDGGGSSGSD